MKSVNFITRIICLLVIVTCLFRYNEIALARQAIVDRREAQIEEIEAYNESVKAMETESPWFDGTYEGKGTGFGGEIRVSLVISQGRISSVEVVSAEDEDETYLNMAKQVLNKIVKKQKTEIDVVSGASFSSRGILDAAADALGKAVR